MDSAIMYPRVMFVDDSRLMRYAGTRFLDGYCDVVPAENGREAWQRVNADTRIKMIFTDLMMPVMDGHELIRLIRASEHPQVRRLPVLVVTSHEEAAARERAIHDGATDFISKPFSAEDLRDALETDYSVADAPAPDLTADEPGETGNRILASDALDEPAHYLARLDQTLSFHQRQQLDLSLLHLQFAGYWRITNRYGQAWADSVMRNLNRVLVELLRQEDSIHRTAPDLFSVILMGTGRKGARVLTNRLRHRMAGAHMHFASMKVQIDLRFAVQFPDINHPDASSDLLDSAFRLLHWRTSQPKAMRPAAAAITDTA